MSIATNPNDAPVQSESETIRTKADELITESEVILLNKKNNNEKLNRLLSFNAAYYIFVFVIIGVPIWYLTVSTYRSSLPFHEIDKITELKRFKVQIQIELIFTSNKSDALNSEFLGLMNQNTDDSNGLVFDYKFSRRVFSENELELAMKSDDIENFDHELSSHVNKIKVYVMNDHLSKKFNLDMKNFLLLSNLYITESDLKDSLSVVSFIKTEYLNAKQHEERVKNKLNIKRKLPTKDDLKVLNFDSNYEVTFSFINSKPELYPDWNIESCVEKYFEKTVNQLRSYTNFSIKAQSLLYSEFDFQAMSASRYTDTDEQAYYLKTSELSIMTNHMGNRLGSRISDSSALEFIVYVPPKGPLYIKPDSKDTDSQRTSSFLVPRWGGVYIQNNLIAGKVVKVDEAMKYFLTQFIDLIGIKLNKNPGVIRSKIYSTEIHNYLLTNTINNLLTSINTMKSLSSLLTKIQEMVIVDKIADEIKTCIEAAKRCIVLLEQGELEQAFFESKTAFSSSEKAFFDQSLLGQLYFPEDQRFAIYIPLFIPVGIPLALSLKSLLIAFISKYRKEKMKTD